MKDKIEDTLDTSLDKKKTSKHNFNDQELCQETKRPNLRILETEEGAVA